MDVWMWDVFMYKCTVLRKFISMHACPLECRYFCTYAQMEGSSYSRHWLKFVRHFYVTRVRHLQFESTFHMKHMHMRAVRISTYRNKVYMYRNKVYIYRNKGNIYRNKVYTYGNKVCTYREKVCTYRNKVIQK